jgi:hypothetical protein
MKRDTSRGSFWRNSRQPVLDFSLVNIALRVLGATMVVYYIALVFMKSKK